MEGPTEYCILYQRMFGDENIVVKILDTAGEINQRKEVRYHLKKFKPDMYICVFDLADGMSNLFPDQDRL